VKDYYCPEPYTARISTICCSRASTRRLSLSARGRACGPGEPQGPVLDLCCGTGRVLVPLLEAALEVEGVDLYPA